MFSIRSILDCLLWNVRMLRKNPRLFLSLLLGFLICFLLTEKTLSLSQEFLTDVQLFEPFVWCFADSDSILFASLALLLLLSQIPRLDTPAAYLIFRTNRLNWLMGQLFTAVILSVGYAAFLLLCSMALAAGNAFTADRWSDTATLLSFSPTSFEVALAVVRKTIKLTSPYACTGHIFLLMGQYALLMTTLNLAVSLRWGKRAGMTALIAMSLLAWLLTPARFMVWLGLDDNLAYYANLWAAWISPLQQATYTMHNFGYDKLPTIGQTHLLFSGVNLVLMILSSVQIKHVQFFTPGGNDNG